MFFFFGNDREAIYIHQIIQTDVSCNNGNWRVRHTCFISIYSIDSETNFYRDHEKSGFDVNGATKLGNLV